MFDVYDQVNAVWLWLPWFFTALFLFLWAAQIKAYRNQGRELEDGKKAFGKQVNYAGECLARAELAEAEARELKTALDEKDKKLKAVQGPLRAKVEEINEGPLFVFGKQTIEKEFPAKNAKKAGKTAKTVGKKKLTKPLAKAKARK